MYYFHLYYIRPLVNILYLCHYSSLVYVLINKHPNSFNLKLVGKK